MKLIYRFACWLERRALDLQDWSKPELPQIDLHDAVVGAINRDPVEFWDNAVAHNALLAKLIRENQNG